jgi:hypothetical protein
MRSPSVVSPAFLVRLLDVFKRSASRLVAWFSGVPRRSVPAFTSPHAAWDYLAARYTYTGDPVYGVVDFYVHPEVLQAALEAGTAARLSVDCDDVAAWAYTALSAMGAEPELVVLYDRGLRGSHCVCVYRWNGQPGAIDTNGVHALPDLTEATLCAHWSGLYARVGYVYTAAVPVAYPF